MRSLALLFVALVGLSQVHQAQAKIDECVICTIAVGILEQMVMDQGVPAANVVKEFCTDATIEIPSLEGVCELALDLFASSLQECVDLNMSPDKCCASMNKCNSTTQCILYKQWPPAPVSQRHLGAREHSLKGELEGKLMPTSLGRTLWSSLLYSVLADDDGALLQVKLAKAFDAEFGIADSKSGPIPVVDHLPLVDKDGDYFSTYERLRGTYWRGRDCDDTRNDVYPGRQLTTSPADTDHNCNGIYGTDPVTKKSYEELYCQGFEQRGIINLGDSVTAHFRIPPDMLDGATLNNSTYSQLLELLLDEADWPQCSWGTGFQNASVCPYSILGVDSLALHLRARNLCNHRDYQNIGVNGARTGAMAPPGIINAMKSRNVTDQPALVIYALVGNDVCNGHPGFGSMTTPQEFYTNVVNSLNYLEQNLRPGSYVGFSGLVDGRVLFDTLQDQIHPLGVPYPDFYDYLNCIGSSPCWGWMNTNETVRNMTWAVAESLNAVYPHIISTLNYTNFQMIYNPPNFNEIIAKWVASGHQAKDLIEPTDGFHPSQTANVLLAQDLWNILETNYPQALGDANPNNAAILSTFGDQGGY